MLYSVGTAKYIMACVYHYRILQNRFTALKIPCELLIFSLLSFFLVLWVGERAPKSPTHGSRLLSFS